MPVPESVFLPVNVSSVVVQYLFDSHISYTQVSGFRISIAAIVVEMTSIGTSASLIKGAQKNVLSVSINHVNHLKSS